MKGLYCHIVMLTGLVLTMGWADNLRSAETPLVHPPGLEITIEPSSATLGETVRLILTYRLPEGALLPEELEIGGIKDLTVVHRQTTSEKIIITVLVDQLGSWKTGDLSLTYLDQDGTPQHLSAPAASIPVLSNLGEKPEEADLRPIQDIVPTRSKWLPYLPWAAGFLGLLIVALGLFWWQKKRRVEEIRAEVMDPPHMQAKKELERLNRQKLFETGHVKGFYFRFSEILRQYLGAIRGFRAVELTTEEISTYVNTDLDRTLVELLKQTDLVKFADAVPTVARKEEQLLAAISFIEKTGPSQGNGETGGAQGGKGL